MHRWMILLNKSLLHMVSTLPIEHQQILISQYSEFMLYLILLSGPSGANSEYLLNLAEALREIAPESHDEHLFELEHKVKELLYHAKETQ